MANSDYSLERLPTYLQYLADSSLIDSDHTDLCSVTGGAVQILTIPAISLLDSPSAKYTNLLLRRHFLTEELGRYGLYPPLLYQRALVYEALGYADLAAADAFVTYTLCTTVRSEEWISDLEPVEQDGEAWPSADDQRKNLTVLVDALVVLCRALLDLGVEEDAYEKLDELVDLYGGLSEWDGDREELVKHTKELLQNGCSVFEKRVPRWHTGHPTNPKFGRSRREIYPWNVFEPDRNTDESLLEINSLLARVSSDLVAKVTVLPALNENGSSSDDSWHQLGLFARTNLAPGTEILAEDSLLTAIRPLDDALCDACGADLESVDRAAMRQCPGEDCDTTFCSKNCATRAANEYHKPNIPPAALDDGDGDNDDESVQSDYPPPHAPFCGNTALHEIGRTSSTNTAEWDLYFLLLTRTIQMSTTQSTHPLSLPTTKYLWGDFTTPPSPFDPIPSGTLPSTLPWSLHHNLSLPLQYFETLMHSRPELKPYSMPWLAQHDWWIQSTLLAKFRGVANAQQSTFDGKAEIAAVHPCWCLANHSCAPNVSWTPTGTRRFVVREGEGERAGEGKGIKAGEEIWSHYTDVRLEVRERRERLMEVLGGVCRCGRCVKEAGET